jgi:hypothetical protein
MFLAEQKASGLVFMFYTPDLFFGCTEGSRSRFHVLRSQSRFLRYRGRQVPFSCFAHFRRCRGHLVPFSRFALPNMFSAMPSASGPVFMFCAPGLVFGGPEGDRSRYHVLRVETSFWLFGGCRVPFSCFALPDTFSGESRVPDAVFIFWALGVISCDTEGVRNHFHVLRSRTRFQRYRGHRVPFSCFPLPNSFSAVPRVSGTVFMFRALGLIFGGTEGVDSRFHVMHV